MKRSKKAEWRWNHDEETEIEIAVPGVCVCIESTIVRKVRQWTVAVWAPGQNWRVGKVLHDQVCCDK